MADNDGSRMRQTVFALSLACVSTTGCLVSEPPEYDPRSRSPILLDLVNAKPPITELIVVPPIDPLTSRPTIIDFDIPVRSEDEGEDVWFALHTDYLLARSKLAYAGNKISPSTFEQQRSIAFKWEPASDPAQPLSNGCYQLSLLVAHESGWSIPDRRPELGAPLGEEARAVWWLNMYPEPGQADTLEGCPNRDGLEL